MQISSTAKHHQGTFSSLSTLQTRHTSAAENYEQLLSQIEKDGPLKEMIGSLMTYHQNMKGNIKQVLENLPDIPVKPNTEMTANYASFGDMNTTAVEIIAKTCRSREEEIFKVYKDLLDNDGIPEEIHDTIEKNAKRAQDVIGKLERISKSGVERDMNV